ncbi:MAG: PilZ domain-containing protein [bacterium]|nr:PilZ domain-containing protein [bacterium]
MTDEERRQESRHHFEARGWLSWRDGGGERRQSRGYCLNISESGLCIEMADSVAVGTEVKVGLAGVELKPAIIIHSKRVGPRYVLGLEFIQTQAREAAS